MGITHSDVTNNVKAQADAQESETYKLVDLKGSGELIKLMKDPFLQKNKAKLDEEIHKKVIKCLYNDGKGEEVRLKKKNKANLKRCLNFLDSNSEDCLSLFNK